MLFTTKAPIEKTGLEKARDAALLELDKFSADSQEYAKVLAHVADLTRLIDLERSERLSPNTMASVLGNAFIAVLVVGYESKNVVTSKVTTFLRAVK